MGTNNYAVTGIGLNQAHAYIEHDSILYLWPEIKPDNASITTCAWISSDPSIATVDENGIVYSKSSNGITTITVTSLDGGFTASCIVNVQDVVIPVSALSIIVPENIIYHYDYAQLTPVISPDTATDKVVTWKSSNEAIATIDETGKLYARYFGTITITATTEDSQCSTKMVTAVDENGLTAVDENGNILSDVIKVALSTSVDITILPVPVKGISFEELIYAVPVTNAIQTTIVFDPPYADNKNITYFSSDTDTISVSASGLVTGISGGSASVYAISEDGGFKAKCTIKVLGNYVPNVTDFKIESVTQVSDGIKYSFTFNHDLLFMGGYELFYSYNKSAYTIAQFYADTNLQAVSKRNDNFNFIHLENEVCYISFTLPSGTVIDGHAIYFRIRRISVNRRDKSSYTKVITSYTYPSTPEKYDTYLKLQVRNENDKIVLKFNNIEIQDINSAVSKIKIVKNLMTEDRILSMTDLKAECASISKNDVVVVRDYRRQSLWCGRAADDNYFDLTDSLLVPYSHTYTTVKPPYINNLKMYMESTDEFLVSDITDLSETFFVVTDNQVAVDSVVLYKVLFLTPDDTIYSQIECPVYVRKIDTSHIYYRPLEASATTMLKNVGWKNMRDVLIDAHYYNKTTWDLPFSKKNSYEITGYLGIARCYVDIYLNEVFYKTETTDDYGSFTIRYYFPIGTTTVSAQARTLDSLHTSPKSVTLTIRTNYVYSWFATLAAQHSQILQQNNLMRQQICVNTADETGIKNLYGKLTGLSIAGSEPLANFAAYVKGALPLYNNIGKTQAITDLITLFESNVEGIDSIRYIPNAKFEEIKVPGYSFITFPYTQNILPRAKYKYTVTACTADAQETDGTSIDLDLRYSPQSLESVSRSVLKWTPVVGASFYRVYRGTYDSNNICVKPTLLTTLYGTPYTTFVDPVIRPSISESYTPPLYNVSALANISDLKHLNYYRMNSWENLLKKPNYFTILISMVGMTVLPDYLLTRFNQMLRVVTPAEQFYRITVFNDNTISTYNTSAELISSISNLSVTRD